MDKGWSEKNSRMQSLLNRKETFRDGIALLIELRADVFAQVTQILNEFPEEAFYKMPFAGADGYHSKTLSYSIWHIFRIEDIVAHEMIAGDEQILFKNGYVDRTHSPIITTGNELMGEAIADFSRQLDRWELYHYAQDVLESTNSILLNMEYQDLKRKFGEDYKEKLKATKCVSEDEEAVWLIEYWCGKDVKGLIKMPFSRHHIMHVEAMRRIKNKLCKDANKSGLKILKEN